MEYRELLNRYIDSVGWQEADSKTFRRFRDDFSDALVEVYGESSPQSVYREQITKTEDLFEDFEDSVLIDNLVLSGLTIGSGKATTTTTGKATLSKLQKINGLTLRASALIETPPASTFCSIKVELFSQIGEELFSQTVNLSSPEGAVETFTFDVAASQVNMSLVITLTRAGEASDISLLDFLVVRDRGRLLLPPDFFLPLQVKFEATASRKPVVSNEILQERFELWTPNRMFNEQGELIAITQFQPIYFSSENLDFDRSVGYFFDRQPEGTYFHWKPTIDGTLIIVYSYLPNEKIGEGDQVTIHRAFIDAILYNAILRGLRKRIVLQPSRTEAEVITNAKLLKEYQAEYLKALQKFRAFMKATAETVRTIPFNYLNDPDMELN